MTENPYLHHKLQLRPETHISMCNNKPAPSPELDVAQTPCDAHSEAVRRGSAAQGLEPAAGPAFFEGSDRCLRIAQGQLLPAQVPDATSAMAQPHEGHPGLFEVYVF